MLDWLPAQSSKLDSTYRSQKSNSSDRKLSFFFFL